MDGLGAHALRDMAWGHKLPPLVEWLSFGAKTFESHNLGMNRRYSRCCGRRFGGPLISRRSMSRTIRPMEGDSTLSVGHHGRLPKSLHLMNFSRSNGAACSERAGGSYIRSGHCLRN